MSSSAGVRNRESYFSQTSVICFYGDLAAVRIIGVFARRQLTVFTLGIVAKKVFYKLV